MDFTKAELYTLLNLRPADRPLWLARADLGGAYLSKADLREANLSGADLSKANLSGADLSKANLERATVTLMQLAMAKTREGARLPDGTLHK